MQLPDFREGSNIRLCQNDMFLVYIIFQEREIIPINFLPPKHHIDVFLQKHVSDPHLYILPCA